MASIEVETKANGERRYLVRYRTPTHAQRKRRFRRRAEAERFKAAVEHSKTEGLFVDPKAGRQTFGAYAERWLSTKVDVRPKTLVNIEGRLRNHVLPVFGRHAIAAITTEDVRDWVAALVRDKGLAADTVKAIFLTASQVFDAAEVDRVIGRSPCVAMRRKLPRPKVRAEMLFLDVDQVELLVGEIEDRYRALVLMAAYTGARAGELEALRTDRVNWLRRRYHVVESLSEVRGRLAFGPTKTFEARWVPMPNFVADALREHVEAYPSSDRLVFTSAEGTPLRHRNFMRRHFKPAVVRAGLPEQLRFHDLRHTAAALLIAEGATMEQVKQILGHSTIRVTSDTYGHLFDDHADPLMEALAARRGQIGVPNACPGPVVNLAETRISAGRDRR